MTTVVNTSTSFHLRVSKIRWTKKKTSLRKKIADQTKMADFILEGGRQTRTQALDLSGKNVCLSRPPKEPFLKTIEQPWTKKILSKGGRRNIKFNPTLMNKLIRIE